MKRILLKIFPLGRWYVLCHARVLVTEQLWMAMNTRMDSEPNCPSYCLGHLPLVYRTQACMLRMLDHAHAGHEL